MWNNWGAQNIFTNMTNIFNIQCTWMHELVTAAIVWLKINTEDTNNFFQTQIHKKDEFEKRHQYILVFESEEIGSKDT